MTQPTPSSASAEPARALAIVEVRARGIVKMFGRSAALRGIDLQLRAGELTLIEGENGSGKTTLLKILGGLVRPTSGEVSYPPLGSDLWRVRREVGWVSHEALCYAELSGRANVALAARLFGVDPDEAWRRLDPQLDLGRFSDRPLGTLSRGQRQRIALARALVGDPCLLLLDEPTAGLDRAGVAHLCEIVGERLRQGAIAAIVTHEATAFGGLPSRRVELRHGKVATDR